MSDVPGDSTPDHCILEHRMFSVLSAPLFRRAEGGDLPMMVVTLGENNAAVSLASLQAEFGIADDSPDGRMLGLIARALDFVVCLRPGDPLPSEVLSGKASWQPAPAHLRLATAKLRLQLVAWLNAGAGTANAEFSPERLLHAEDDPRVRQQVQEAFDRAAKELGAADREEVIRMVESLAEELAYIEALRDRLLRRVRLTAAKIVRLTRVSPATGSTTVTLSQVHRLITTALKQLDLRFDELDAASSEVMPALQNIETHRAFIRSRRDWLFCSLRAWEPILDAWDQAPAGIQSSLMDRTYHFLAPRFMAVTEWTSQVLARNNAKPGHQVVW